MPRLPAVRRPILTLAATCAAATLAFAAQASGLDAFRDPDPATETAGPADAAFAESCRASARARLGGGQFEFDRPGYAAQGGRQIVRMDLLGPGQRRNPDQILRAVCVREVAGQPVEAMIFDGPADGIGPRVVAIPGPTPEMRPRRPDPAAVAAAAPTAPGAVIFPDYNYSWLPGIAVPPDRHFRDRDGRDRRLKPALGSPLDPPLPRGQPQFVAPPKAKSQKAMRFGSPAATRMGTGAFIR
jgi:hypothetical protein